MWAIHQPVVRLSRLPLSPIGRGGTARGAGSTDHRSQGFHEGRDRLTRFLAGLEMSEIIPLDALLGGLAFIAGGAFGGILLGIGIARKMWRI